MKRAGGAIAGNKPKKQRTKAPPKSNTAATALYAKKRVITLDRNAGTPEMKVTFFDMQQNVSTSGYMQNLLANLNPGLGAVNGFIGNEILPTSIRYKFSITMGPLGAVPGDGTNIIRLILFQWADASTPVPNGILNSGSAPLSMLSWTNIENITVLADRQYALSQMATSSGSYAALTDSIYVKGKKIAPIKFNPSTAVWQKGCIYALWLTDSSVPPAPYITAYGQVTYTDQ